VLRKRRYIKYGANFAYYYGCSQLKPPSLEFIIAMVRVTEDIMSAYMELDYHDVPSSDAVRVTFVFANTLNALEFIPSLARCPRSCPRSSFCYGEVKFVFCFKLANKCKKGKVYAELFWRLKYCYLEGRPCQLQESNVW
jgi:hypothetical protein